MLLTWRIWWAPKNARRLQMGFNSVFKGLNLKLWHLLGATFFATVAGVIRSSSKLSQKIYKLVIFTLVFLKKRQIFYKFAHEPFSVHNPILTASTSDWFNLQFRNVSVIRPLTTNVTRICSQNSLSLSKHTRHIVVLISFPLNLFTALYKSCNFAPPVA